MKLIFRNVITIVVTFLFSIHLGAQFSSTDIRNVKKSTRLYQKKKYTKAITAILGVQAKDPLNEELWNMRITYEEARYNDELARVYENILKQVDHKKKNIKVDDAQLTIFRSEMLNACVQATQFCRYQALASSLLNEFLLAPKFDTAVADEAHDAYQQGDQEYNSHNWNAAIRLYKKALEKDSSFFSAAYSIAMACYQSEEFDQAAEWFTRCTKMVPGKYVTYHSLAETYIRMHDPQKALDACIDGIMVYPDVSFFTALDTIAKMMNKTFNRHWQVRYCVVNTMKLVPEQLPYADSPWQFYPGAKEKIVDYCNPEGVVSKTASFTEAKYLETFSWEMMFRRSREDEEGSFPEMAFARKMQKEGMLDCYCFISMYHYYLHEQFRDFVNKNPEKVRKYISEVLIF